MRSKKEREEKVITALQSEIRFQQIETGTRQEEIIEGKVTLDMPDVDLQRSAAAKRKKSQEQQKIRCRERSSL